VPVLEILLFPDPILLRKSEPVVTFDKRLKLLVDDMYETMYHDRGVGLAAPQVGISQRLFVLNCSYDEDGADGEVTMINPEIISGSDPQLMDEGCLSFPGIHAKVERFQSIRVRFQDVEGNFHEIDADDLLAQAVQHELDHLEGKVFVSLLSPGEYAKVASQVEAMRRDYKRAQTGR